jgi:lipopolysaccharide assembly protein A
MGVLRLVAGIALFVALLFIAFQNADSVKLRFFNLATWEAPLVFVVLIAFAAGAATGLLAAAVKVVRLKRQVSRMRREHRRHPAPAPHGAAPGTAPASGPGFDSREDF